MNHEEMMEVEGGWIIAVAGITVTISIFSWGQGEKTAAANVRKYGKAKAAAWLRSAGAIILAVGGSFTAGAYLGGYAMEISRH